MKKNDESKVKLYLCGPMSAVRDFNRPAFKAARERLRKEGFEVVCPVELNADRDPGKHMSWHDYMRRDIKGLMECWAVATLPGFERSRGANIEAFLAASLDMKVMDVEWWIEKQRKRKTKGART